MLDSLLSLNLAVDVLEVINAKGLALFRVEELGSLSFDFSHSSNSSGLSGLMSLRVQHSQHLVVLVIDIELHWVLVVGEESVVSIGKVSEGTSLYTKNIIIFEYGWGECLLTR